MSTQDFAIRGHVCHTPSPDKIEIHEDAYAVCVNGRCAGIFTQLPERFQKLRVIDVSQKLVIPGMIDLATKGGGSFFGKVGSFEEGYEFDALVLDDLRLPVPRSVPTAERLERAFYTGQDRGGIVRKFVAGREIDLIG